MGLLDNLITLNSSDLIKAICAAFPRRRLERRGE